MRPIYNLKSATSPKSSNRSKDQDSENQNTNNESETMTTKSEITETITLPPTTTDENNNNATAAKIDDGNNSDYSYSNIRKIFTDISENLADDHHYERIHFKDHKKLLRGTKSHFGWLFLALFWVWEINSC